MSWFLYTIIIFDGSADITEADLITDRRKVALDNLSRA
jgi:hypothetical protein